MSADTIAVGRLLAFPWQVKFACPARRTGFVFPFPSVPEIGEIWTWLL
jgi:hypothetical protein